MKVLATGRAGYIGRICIERLLDRGEKKSVFDFPKDPRKSVDPGARSNARGLNTHQSISGIRGTPGSHRERKGLPGGTSRWASGALEPGRRLGESLHSFVADQDA